MTAPRAALSEISGVNIYKNAWFAKFARKERISDAALRDSVGRGGRGLIDADLGGELIKPYKSEAMAAVHQMMEGLYQRGTFDKQTMREFDEGCLIPTPVLRPEEIKAIRESERVSQPVFARYLNVSKNLVSEWERGVK